jgi:hypothetical protein
MGKGLHPHPSLRHNAMGKSGFAHPPVFYFSEITYSLSIVGWVKPFRHIRKAIA